jgi:hypothetical protein
VPAASDWICAICNPLISHIDSEPLSAFWSSASALPSPF